LVQKGLNEGRLNFGDKRKPQMQVESDRLKDASMMYTDIAGCNMMEAIVDVVEGLFVEAEVDVAECKMVDITKDEERVEETTTERQFNEKLKIVSPTAEEELIDFLNRCKLKNSKVMLCPRCSAVFDKEATKGLEGSIPTPKKRGKWSGDHRPKFSFTKRYIPFINNSSTTNYVNKGYQGKAFVPYVPNQKWVQSTHKNVQHGKNNAVKRSTSTVDSNKNGISFESKKYAYNNNYKGKNLMTRTQWRRYQMSKKGVAASLEDKAINPNDGQRMVEPGRRPAKERLSLPLVEDDPNENDELGSEFLDSEPNFDVICNVVSILPIEHCHTPIFDLRSYIHTSFDLE